MDLRNKPILAVLVIYIICFIFRVIEYFVLRTDSTFLGEALIHKLIGIVILIISAKYFSYKKEDLGFKGLKELVKILWGLGFGIACFAIAYLTEILVLRASGKYKSLNFYVSTYSVDGNFGNHTEILFFLICFIGNIINVVMEEGVFRGLFQKILDSKYKFITSALIASILFGLWHIIAPVRSLIDGNANAMQFFMNALILVLSSTLVGFKFALITKLTGSLYMAMGDHFVNNTLVNILHVLSTEGADSLQTMRISIAQSLSFIIILIVYVVYIKKARNNNKHNINI